MKTTRTRQIRPLLLLLLSSGLLFSLTSAHAASYWWDADGDSSGSTGGTGIWNISAPPLWRNGSSTGTLTNWPSTNPSTTTAVFGGTVGRVTIASGTTLYADGLTFENSTWEIDSGNSSSKLVLTGASVSIAAGANNVNFNTHLELSNGITTATAGIIAFGYNPTAATGANSSLVIGSGGTFNVFSSGARGNLTVGRQDFVGNPVVPSLQSSFDLTGGKTTTYLHSLRLGVRVLGNGGGSDASSGDITAIADFGSDATSVFDLIGTGPGTVGGIILYNDTYTGNVAGTLNFGGGTNTLTSTHATNAALEVGRVQTINAPSNTNGSNTASATGVLNHSGGITTLSTTDITNKNVLALALRDSQLNVNTTATGTLNLTGGTLNIIGGDVYGGGGTSIVNLNGGTLDLNGGNLGRAGGLITTLNLQSGTLQDVLQINNGAVLNKSTTGTLRLSGTNSYSGGTTLSAGTLQAGSDTAFGSGALTLTAGKLSSDSTTARAIANAVTFGGDVTLGDAAQTGVLTFNGAGTLTGNRTITTASNVTYSGAIGGGTNGFTKAGAGTSLTFSAANTYTGATIVSGGTLILSGSGSVASNLIQVQQGGSLNASGLTGGLQLQSGQTLQNKGSFTGNLTALSGSIYAPGNSPGIANQAGNLQLNTGSTFEWELIANTSTGAGTTFDQTDFSVGGLTIQSGVTADLVFDFTGSTVLWADAFWSSNQQWLVFTGATSLSSVSGIFTTLNVGMDSMGNTLAPSQGTFSFTNVGNEVYLTYSIPEPSTTLLLTGALMAAVIFRRHVKRHSF